MAVPLPALIVTPGAVALAAGAVNLTVVAPVVPNAGTPLGKLKPLATAVNAAVAAGAVAVAMVTAGMSFTTTVAAGASPPPPPQAASAAAMVRPKVNLASVAPELEKLSMVVSL